MTNISFAFSVKRNFKNIDQLNVVPFFGQQQTRNSFQQ